MFIDEATVRVRGGRGGSGIIHFLSNRHNPRGGPDGGNGGPGGAVILQASNSLSTLFSFRNRPLFEGEHGTDGGQHFRNGAHGKDRVVHVPVGTVVRTSDDGEVLADLAMEGDEVVVAEGGEGGRGNSAFTTSSRQAPKIRERGLPGMERTLRLELKLIADVGIIGYPNVGKSSLISSISGVKAKVADYPFTTIVPNLGVVDVDGKHQFVAVDIPGLIEGAHAGKGLGDRFLRHIERTRVFIHMVDVASLEGRDPLEDLRRINEELQAFNPNLAQRRQIVVGNKADLIDEDEAQALKERFAEKGMDLDLISVATMNGVRRLVQRTYTTLIEEREREISQPTGIRRRVYRFREETGFRVEKSEDVYIVRGDAVEKLLQKVVLNSRDAAEYVADRLERMGVIKELRRQGYEDGDIVRIGGMDLELEG